MPTLQSCFGPRQDYGCATALHLLWDHTDWIRRLDLFVLGGMLLYIVVVVSLGFYRYHSACHQLRVLRRDAAGLHRGSLEDVMRAALGRTRNPVTTIVASAHRAFAEAPTYLSTMEVIHLAIRALERTLRTNRAYFSPGINLLGSIAATAPFLGLLGTCLGLLDSFRGSGMQRDAFIAMLLSDLAAAPITTLAGLLVVIPAICGYNYLVLCKERIEPELSNFALMTITDLGTGRRSNNRPERQTAGLGGIYFAATSRRTRVQERKKLPAFAVTAVPVLACCISAFMVLPLHKRPVGLPVHLNHAAVTSKTGLLPGPIVRIGAVTNKQVAVYVDSKRTSMESLDSTIRYDLKTHPQSIAFLEVEDDVSWKDAAIVLDILHGAADQVVLLPATLTRSR